jgi:hypothetical protein
MRLSRWRMRPRRKPGPVAAVPVGERRRAASGIRSAG